MLTVQHVDPAGRAARFGIRRGDSIIDINGHAISDVIDYRFHCADERLRLKVERGGKIQALTVRKEPDDDLGLEFPMFQARRCRNRCIFCFVDQMPKGCRRSLLIKDDDYRASFLHGNYITLGNLGEADWERIRSQRLSPLYISVHATDPELRGRLLGNPRAPDILTNLKRLAAYGIRMHTQIVLCPGINDGKHLAKTIDDLARLFPHVLSIAAVPVGLTAHRRGLYPLKPFTKISAGKVIEAVEDAGRRFKKKFGVRLAYPSDEFYIKAGRTIPQPSFYEDFPQIENGVGMVSRFLKEARAVRLPRETGQLVATVLSGVSFRPFLDAALQGLAAVRNLRMRHLTVRNRFFGPTVTVAGLLTGGDILHALRGGQPGDLVVVPSQALIEEGDVFLDGMTLKDLERRIGTPVRAAATFGELIGLLRREERR